MIKSIFKLVSKFATGQFVGDIIIAGATHILKTRYGLKAKNKIQDTLEREGMEDIKNGLEKQIRSSSNKVDDTVLKFMKKIGLI
jgi:hypothetical protein